MSKFLVTMMALALTIGVQAQQDDGMDALNATDISNPDTYLDLHVLRAGKQLSKHYSRFLERGDSLYDAYMKANPNAEGVPST